jgi:hypothetical protein
LTLSTVAALMGAAVVLSDPAATEPGVATIAVSPDPAGRDEAVRRPAVDTFTIRLANGSEAERKTEEQLERILRTVDLERWIETREILIDQNATPHSHPVLTVDTDYLDSDDGLIATFLHEQFHWRANRFEEQVDSAVSEFRRLYPEVPVRNGQGARSEYSTYLHLIVCDLEFQAMTLLRGRERAADLLSSYDHYRWIYQHVLTDPAVRQVTTRTGLTIR